PCLGAASRSSSADSTTPMRRRSKASVDTARTHHLAAATVVEAGRERPAAGELVRHARAAALQHDDVGLTVGPAAVEAVERRLAARGVAAADGRPRVLRRAAAIEGPYADRRDDQRKDDAHGCSAG